MASFNVSIEELKSHHAVDRHLYARLTAELGRDPDQAMQVMAFWLWFEEMGFPSIILAVRTLPDRLVHAVYDEAISWLAALESENPLMELTGDQLPITYYSLFDGGISLQFLYENRGFVMDDVVKTLTEVCTKIFDDDVGLEDLNALAPVVDVDPFVKQFRPGGKGRIVVQEIGRPGPGRIIMPSAPFIPHGLHPAFSPLLHFRGIGYMPVEGQQSIAPLFVPGFYPKDGAFNFEVGESSGPAAKKPQKDSGKDNVMFLTFSREDPVSEGELRDYLSSTYGDVAEEILMEETQVQVQPLFARVTFRSQETVDAIMNGNERMQLAINGKPVWARVFIPRE